jgi:hypothetical protein
MRAARYAPAAARAAAAGAQIKYSFKETEPESDDR